jgi:hypothetical protein
MLALTLTIVGHGLHAASLNDGFASPTHEYRPETWFHLIGGNVDKTGLTKDLEAISAAGIQGVQLFHGKGSAWTGVKPQIQVLSPTWDNMIAHVADETTRLGLHFSMQNCPGWAMSGGPWITPDKAMRHLIWSRKDIQGDKKISIALDRPEPSTDEDWRDYREVAVLAFPTPSGDNGEWLRPFEVRCNRNQAAWLDMLAGKEKAEVLIQPDSDSEWLEIIFDKPTTLRSVELPAIAKLMKGRVGNSSSQIIIQVSEGKGWRDLVRHVVPRGTWQDTDFPYVLAVPDASATKYRLVFESANTMVVTFLRFSSAARSQDWRGQAAYALRSRERINPPVQASEAWVRSTDVVDLTEQMDANGQLIWNAPSGQWTVVRFGHVNTGAKNKPAPKEATGFECDKLSAAGAEQHFAGYIGRLTKPDGPAGGGRMQGMLLDSWECRTQTWTPSIEREFASRRGYPLRRWLPALAGWVMDDHRTSERFLRDWRATISDLLVDNYFGKLAELAHARGMKLSFETAIGDVAVGDILHYYGKADMPMCEVWNSKNPNYEDKAIAPTVSAAHVYGKTRINSETFPRFGTSWSEHPFELKPVADRALSRGVTHIVFHTYTHNPLDRVPGTTFGGGIGTPFLRGQTWWKHMPLLTDYLARCGFMLERGLPVADVLWYLGDDLDHKPRQDQPFPNGYRFDYLNADVLLNRLSVREGALTIPEGTSWRAIWLPREQCSRLTPATLGKLKQLIEAGATVIGEAPQMNPSLIGGVEADRKFASVVKELWGDKPQQAGDRNIGKGRLLWGGELAAHLIKVGIEQDVTGANPGTWFHRRDGVTDIYFVVAEQGAIQNATLRFRARGIPEFWDPLTGKTSPVPVFQQDQSGTTIAMQLPASGSVFVVFRPGVAASAFEQIAVNGQSWLNAMDAKRVNSGEPSSHSELSEEAGNKPSIEPAALVMEVLPGEKQFVAWIDGDYQFKPQGGPPASRKVAGTRSLTLTSGWTLSFPSGWDAPSTLDLGDLKPWSELKDKATRHFSGSATYRTTVRLDSLKADERVQLDLGRVANIAEVRINGRKAAVLWTAPFRTDITEHLKTGSNEIEIEVTNTWSNRLAFDASLPEAERKTWTIEGPKANSKVKTAGLEGPVHLRIGKRLDLSKTSKK